MEQRDSIDFRDTEIRKLFLRFLLPTLLGMVSSAVFIITDGIFVGRGVGSDALAAVNLAAPLYTLATGLGLMFGMGSSVVASVNLARGKKRVAGINITQALIVPTLFVAIATVMLLVFQRSVLVSLGTPTDLMLPAREYFVWFTPFFAPLALFNIVMFAVRLDGSPKFVMYCTMLAAGLNIVLDYVFIFIFGWGLTGAAVATGIGYTLGASLMVWRMVRHSKTLRPVPLKLSRHSLQLTARNLGYMAYIGFPALINGLAISCMVIVGNFAFIRYTGKEGVAAYSIACYLFPVIFTIYNGIIQSAQPIISYNYGAGETLRARRAFRLALITAAGFGCLICIATWQGSGYIAGLFLTSGTPAYTMATEGLQWFSLGYLFFGINVTATGYLQSIERSKAATWLTVVRGIILMWLAFQFLPQLLGETGIWLAIPAAELITTLILLAATLLSCRQK